MLTSVLLHEELKVLAYLDPVSGGIILQVLLGILLVISLLLRAFWRKIKSFLAWITGKTIAEQNDPADSSAPKN